MYYGKRVTAAPSNLRCGQSGAARRSNAHTHVARNCVYAKAACGKLCFAAGEDGPVCGACPSLLSRTPRRHAFCIRTE